MTTALSHRGPDGDGYFVDPESPVYLGHRRLAIIDLSGGHQPMWNEDGQVGVVFNGEIYNHADLRIELERRGHVFRSDHSDTEVLVHGYEEWSSALPEKLNGMYAFAVYDRRRRQIFMARDRFGEKPLYYSHRPDLFAFSSEVSSLIRHRGIGSTLDERSLQKFFGYGYLPAPNSIYRDCRKLPNGCFAVYDVAAGTLREQAYWRFQLEPDNSLTDADIPRLAEELRHLVLEAVRRRLISDVPLGIFLSGGIDSSTVLAAAVHHQEAASVRSFTVGFTEPSFDESPYARALAKTLGTHHHEKILDIQSAQHLVPSLLGQLDEPLADGSLLPTYLLSAFTRESVTVALSGDGGDELFAGYDPFLALKSARRYSRLVPPWLHQGFRSLADLLPVSSANMSLDFKLRRVLGGLSYPASMWNPAWMAPVAPQDMGDLFYAPLNPEDLYSEAIDVWQRDPSADFVDRTLAFFTNLYLPDDILAKVDRTSMMVSLETRAVFLDNDIVEFCQRLPNHFKLRKGVRKFLLKQAVQGLLPSDVLARRKKGFGIPLAKWLRSIPRVPPMSPIPGIHMDVVKERWLSHRAGRSDQRFFLWGWLALQYGCVASEARQVKAV